MVDSSSSPRELCECLAKVESAYVKRLVIAWKRDPESFPEYVRQLEDIIDLRRKICGAGGMAESWSRHPFK